MNGPPVIWPSQREHSRPASFSLASNDAIIVSSMSSRLIKAQEQPSAVSQMTICEISGSQNGLSSREITQYGPVST